MRLPRANRMTSEHAPIASQTDFIEVHNSAQSARKTIINSSRSNFTILKIIRRDEYISLITEFDSLRLAAFFRSMARPVTNSPSITRGFNYYPGNPSASSCYFKRDYLDSRISQAEHLPTGGDGRQMPPFEIQRAIIMNRVPATREDAAIGGWIAVRSSFRFPETLGRRRDIPPGSRTSLAHRDRGAL